MHRRPLFPLLVLSTAVVLGAAACGGSGSGGGSLGSVAPSATGSPKQGGSAVFGAEQWPQCLNPVTDCTAASWYLYTIAEHVFPRLAQYSVSSVPQASPLITQLPSLDNGGITQNPFTVTYHLNPKAVWSDNTPITCNDVAFTWKAILDTTGTYSTTGYDQIKSIDCSQANTVKINFKSVWVDWVDIFGGALGYILEKAAFPNVNPSKPDLKTYMNDSISFSGGPWMVKSWSQSQAVLVPNQHYWGQKPYLNQVTFVPREDQPSEINSLLAGDVSAIFPQPSNVSLLTQFNQNPNIKAVGANGNFVEALWIQMDQPPMNDPKVREAFAYAMDRQAVIDSVIKLNNPTAQINNCGLWIPGQGPWCPTPGPFAKYTYNPTMATQILSQDGYTKGANGIYEKDGKPLTITISTTAGNARRATTVALLQQKASAAGINLQIKTYDPTDLFSNVAPQGNFQVALYAQGPIIDPSVTAVFSSNQIPTKSNNYAGENWDHWRNPQADTLMAQSDQELDTAKRAQLIQQIGALMAQDLPMVPVDTLPNVSAWRTDKIAGPVGVWNSSAYGLFFNMNQWYVP
jgi:peptide/nickel transport system substrate-binding protein